MTYIPLHIHSEYSIRDSIVTNSALIATAKKMGYPALALTDVCNLFGLVKFYRQCLEAGIKPIIGAELWVAAPNSPKGYHPIVILCQNVVGYKNLTALITRAYQQGQRCDVPLIEKVWLKSDTEGFIVLSGGHDSELLFTLGQSQEKAKTCLAEWMALFPNRFYCEVQRIGSPKERQSEAQLVALAHEAQCPIVAANTVVYMEEADENAHAARVCIQSGMMISQADTLPYYPGQYFKSPEAMKELFQDMPFALENSFEIAKRCSLVLSLDNPILPSFPVPKGQSESDFLEEAAYKGLRRRFDADYLEKNPQYFDRLKHELQVICKMGFPGYFLIVADFIQWAKNAAIPVGPGRGSGAGSLVAYVLAITDLDPIAYELLFERFLNPERVSLPDFDIDFCMDNRDRVIDYVAERYGRAQVSQIATFGTMAAKAVIRDVGRVLGHPYGFVDKLAKLIPFEIGMTLEKALSEEQALKQRYDQEEEVKTLMNLALKLEGITRNVGKHAGGVVIAPAPLTDFAPLYCEENSDSLVIQFDKDDVEAIGLIKFDFLGLRTLTIIDKAVKNVNAILAKQKAASIAIESIPLDDKKTFALLKTCATTAVFQLESRGMKDLIKRLQPDNLDEIIALVALFRPGPLQSGMVDDFINRKMGRQAVEYPHPSLAPLLKATYGVILYQEQVMQIAQTLAGYSLGEADLLRRAMGKKKPEEMAKQRVIFTTGAQNNGVEEHVAQSIFDLMEKFAGYGFNKSHSAAYGLVSYQTAWLKAHYPSAFMAAVLSSDMNHTDKIVNLVEECRSCKIPVLPPDINYCHYDFTVTDDDEILYGLGAIKGLGESAIESIIAERENGPFKDLWDFCRRIDPRKANKKTLETLVKSGAFDSFGLNRGALMAQCDTALHYASQFHLSEQHGQSDLFSESGSVSDQISTLTEAEGWEKEAILQGEKESLGMYFSGHPLDALELELQQMSVLKFRDLLQKQVKRDQTVLLGGLVVSIKTLLTKNGDRMAIVTLDDKSHRFELTVFSDQYQQSREWLVKDQLLIVKAQVQMDRVTQTIKVRAQSMWHLDLARETLAHRLRVRCESKSLTQEKINALKAFLETQSEGTCSVAIEYCHDQIISTIRLDANWNIHATKDNIERITEITDGNVDLAY